MKPAEQYILNQEEPYRTILLQIQLIIEQSLPEAELKYKWKVPFYYAEDKPICYLNVSKGYVDVGFWAGGHFHRHLEHLNSENRKFVKSLRYFQVEDIQPNILSDLLMDAYDFRNVPFKAR